MADSEHVADDEHDVPEAPATWENVVVGEGKSVLGRLIRDRDLADEGEEQVHVAREVREEFRAEHDH